MGLTLQGVGVATPMKAVCSARETETTEVVIDKPDQVVYRSTKTKETGWSDVVLSVLDKTVSILSLLGKAVSLPFPELL